MGSWLLSPILLLAAGVSSWEMHLGFGVTFFLGGVSCLGMRQSCQCCRHRVLGSRGGRGGYPGGFNIGQHWFVGPVCPEGWHTWGTVSPCPFPAGTCSKALARHEGM